MDIVPVVKKRSLHVLQELSERDLEVGGMLNGRYVDIVEKSER